MKVKVYTVFYLAIMVCYLARPVMPFVEYAIHRDYIAKYLCVSRDNPDNTCHGQCHLNQQLQKNAGNNDKDQNDNNNTNRVKTIDDQLMAATLLLPPIEHSVCLLADGRVEPVYDPSFTVFVPPNC